MVPERVYVLPEPRRSFFTKPVAVISLFTAGALLLVTGYLLYVFLPDEPSYVKLVTPVGEDFFSTEFVQGFEAIGAYVIPVTFGANLSTTVVTLLDTGSAQTWFKASTAIDLRSSSFQPYPSSPYVARYMGGDVDGYQGEDALNINGYAWQQRFGVINGGSMLESMGRINGLMGLSRGGCSAFDRADQLCSHANWPLKESVFSFYYDSASWRGIFTAGFIDETLYCQDTLHYVQQNGVYFWSAPIEGFYVNNRKVASNLRGIFDTGTTYMFMNSGYYAKLFEAFTSSADCVNPDFKLEINGKNFTIPVEVLKKNGDAQCALRVEAYQGTTSLSDDLLIGAVFLVNYYTVFDLANDRIGFCTPKHGLTVGRRLDDADERATRISQLLDHPGRNVIPNLYHHV